MKKLNTLIVLLSMCSTSLAFAMGAKRPSANSGNSSSGSNTPEASVPKPTIDMGANLDVDDYQDYAAQVGTRVDQIKGMTELLKIRPIINSDSVDKCFDGNGTHETFSDQISYYILKMLDDTPAKVGAIGSYYGTSSNDTNYFPTSLIRHPLCNVSSSTLSTTIGSKVPDSTTIARINKFVNSANLLRNEVINGNVESKKDVIHLWSTFYSCLAYTESLTTADSNSSKNVASKYSPSSYRKPAGVEFYEDPSQNAESKLNIGLYQFTPSASNNIGPCLKAWNELHKTKASCQINTKGSQAEMIMATGSSLQSFNAFCGIHKMIQTFSIQVNTSKTSATHPANLVNGKLKPQEQRCVSPHFKAGSAYVHFGPFMNSTGSNLSELFSCIDKSL